ncbi:PspC domain-containing protein [Corynebacterium epidermidicanis]|uniref:Phage shock protein C (PspC) family protein n=1 Tax=Corynebacterium epidermidicanis TaxID=1050174 RepID=A0A0G3GNQ5_9CORY|nr:PspC domain-containing protein [Corynebacterium epidermidicanis]AKK02861.1 phage shock protein C (PspC) family protein [Corynebacterium epidermidicanis]
MTNFDNRELTTRPLRRSTTDRMFLGVLGGVGQTYGWDSTMLRVLFVISILLPGPQVILYFIAALLMKNDSSF